MSGTYAQFPSAALEWLTGVHPVRVLALTSIPSTSRLLAQAGHYVLTINDDLATAQRMSTSPTTATAVARPETLPLAACSVDVIFAHQSLQRFAPGLAFPEFARVLTPNGWVAAAHLTRDESVPWVRRLVELMRSIDPSAMAGDFGDAAADTLLASKYFPECETREFRVWVPISQQKLVFMIESQPFVAALPPRERAEILAQAAELYTTASDGLSLHLPYQLRCIKAHVDQNELTTPIQLTDDALIIPL